MAQHRETLRMESGADSGAAAIALENAIGAVERFHSGSAADARRLAAQAEDALHFAIRAGVSRAELAAALELSPRALASTLDGSLRLTTLHPEA